MKLTARYEDGVLIPDRPITPKGETVHIEIPDEEIETAPGRPEGRGAVRETRDLEKEREEIRKLMDEDPFLRELWKDLPDGLPDEPEENETGETVNQRDRRSAFEIRAEWRKENGRPL
jgi:predicted DNA-binding antitoxin AbrB/MazE fold protein